MIDQILDLAAKAAYDFRRTACPTDPLQYLFEEWVPYYRLKWAIARVLEPRRILEIGVRYGYSAAAFLDACPTARYLGIDNDSDDFGGQKGAIQWARRITKNCQAEYFITDSQQLDVFPGSCYDLIHVDGQQDGVGTFHDLRRAIGQAKHILVDGYFWTRDNFLSVSEFLFRYRDLIDSCIVIPGYAGELIITPKPAPPVPRLVSSSSELRDTYTDVYYLRDCGGYDAFKRDKGGALSDARLQSVLRCVEIAPTGRALDLGCGRGEISVGMAGLGHEVLAIDYSESAVALARQAAAAAGALGSIRFFHGDVNQAPFEGSYEVVVASDLIEHLAPHELDRLYSRIASHLSPAGVFVVHTFPNAWHYRYEHPRRVRQARKLGAYLPMDPRSRYEELMHINEQSPRVLKNQLRDHFEHVLFWFADHSMVDPFANLKRPFSRDEMRSAGDLYAVASHFPITAGALVEKMAMRPVPAPVDLTLEVTGIPPSVAAGARFRGRIGLSNRSGIDLKSHPPNPVHLAYHCYSENGSVVVFDGMRTRLPSIKPGVRVELDMDFEAPVLPGRFLFRLTLVQEGVRWFDGPPQNLFSDHWIRVEGVRAQ